jgi:hypothetical protein
VRDPHPEHEKPDRSSPVLSKQIGALGCDYLALGHWHRFLDVSANGVAAYYNEVSYGQQQLNITVACATAPVPAGCASRTAPGGWLQSTSAAPATCDFTTIGNLADQTYIGTARLNAVGGRYYEPAPQFNVYGGIGVIARL